MSSEYSNDIFEQKSKSNYEKLQNSFLNTVNKVRWNKEKSINHIINFFLEEIAVIPNDPFSENLIGILEWEYGVLAKDINSILIQIDPVRKRLLPKERRVCFKNKYYNHHFVTRNRHIRKQIIYDADGDICYITRYKLKIKLKYLFLAILSKTREEKESMERMFLGLQPEVIQKKELQIYFYSPIVNIHTTDLNKYFEFYVDYYSKKLFREFLSGYLTHAKPVIGNHKIFQINGDKEKDEPVDFNTSKFTKAQIVLLTYYYFKELGLEPRVESYVSTMVRFLHIITRTNYTKTKNSVFYKMALKAPNFKTDQNLIKDLEVVKVEFERVELPIIEIEKEIRMAKRNLRIID